MKLVLLVVSAGVYRIYERYREVKNNHFVLIFINVRRYLTFQKDTNICTDCSKRLTVGVISIPIE
jgi:hypothetical protein